MSDELRAAQAREKRLAETVAFYANPETYFAIAMMADRPCGEFIDDFEELEGSLAHPDGHPWTKPGKRARETIKDLYETVDDYHKAVGIPLTVEELLNLAADRIEAQIGAHQWREGDPGDPPDPVWFVSLGRAAEAINDALDHLAEAEAALTRSNA